VSPYATLVVEADGAPQTIVRVEAFEARPAATPPETVVPCADVGWLRLARLPWDPVLATLGAVLTDETVVVRYRPLRRCTVRRDVGGAARFGKVFADGRGRSVHRTAAALRRAGELGFAVPGPDRYDAATRTVWQRELDGAPLKACLLGPDGEDWAERVGRAAATLGRAELRPPVDYDGTAQLARSARLGVDLGRRIPALAPEVDRLLARLRGLHEDSRPAPPRPVHGALHVAQWLVSGSRLGLLDFDCFALGDRELDAGTFVADLDAQNPERVPVDRLREAFLDGYAAVSGPLDPRLLDAYRTHKRLAKALKAARDVRPDGDRRAARRLRAALEGVGA